MTSKTRYFISSLGAFALTALTSFVAEAGILGKEPVALQPWNKIAREKVGPLIISKSGIIFKSGQIAEIKYLRTQSSADFGDVNGVFGDVQVFEINNLSDDAGELRALCDGRKPDYLLALDDNENSRSKLNFLFFYVGPEPRSVVKDDLGSCLPTIFFPPQTERTSEIKKTGLTVNRLPTINEKSDHRSDGSAESGKWRLSEDKNIIDDTTSVYIMLDANGGRDGKVPTLVARCKSNKTELFINWDSYLGDDSSSPYEEFKYVTVRIGNQIANHQKWGLSTDSTATFAPEWAGDLLKEMIKNERFVVQTVPYNENPKIAVFDISGLETPLRRLSEVCGWSLDE